MKIARYELKVVYRKELILTMEDDVDSEELLKIFLETQLKEEKEPSELLGIIAEKVSEEGCTEQCESCQKYCPASKSSDTRNSETGAEEYTIPASNAFGLPHRFPAWQSAAACQGESLKPSENEKGESNNVEVYLWSISRWHYRSSVDVPVAD